MFKKRLLVLDVDLWTPSLFRKLPNRLWPRLNIQSMGRSHTLRLWFQRRVAEPQAVQRPSKGPT